MGFGSFGRAFQRVRERASQTGADEAGPTAILDPSPRTDLPRTPFERQFATLARPGGEDRLAAIFTAIQRDIIDQELTQAQLNRLDEIDFSPSVLVDTINNVLFGEGNDVSKTIAAAITKGDSPANRFSNTLVPNPTNQGEFPVPPSLVASSLRHELAHQLIPGSGLVDREHDIIELLGGNRSLQNFPVGTSNFFERLDTLLGGLE